MQKMHYPMILLFNVRNAEKVRQPSSFVQNVLYQAVESGCCIGSRIPLQASCMNKQHIAAQRIHSIEYILSEAHE